METISSFEVIILSTCCMLATKWVCERLFYSATFVRMLLYLSNRKKYSVLRLWDNVIRSNSWTDIVMTIRCDTKKGRDYVTVSLEYYKENGKLFKSEHQFTVQEWLYNTSECVRELNVSIKSI